MRRKGTYVILIFLGSDTEIRVGALGTFRFSEGVYCYVGSALGGLDPRIRRHLRKDKVLKWHADYLTTRADSCRAYISYPDYIPECDLARIAVACGMEPSVKGFGCSDCGCYTHLFMTDDDSLETFLRRTEMTEFIDG
ncbi:MAG: GIY-YIG nuclease family protein [Thermoplasmata archaeon]|jgi:Uri superfamily endonuclease|nr:GIY-YIG nuclease family protein [Thermoplasmata archaeon]